MRGKQLNMNVVMQLLELPMVLLQPLNNSIANNNVADAEKRLKTFQETVKKQRRVLAKKYHPDICKDDKKMKVINKIVDDILNAKINILTPVRQPVTVYYSYTVRTDGATTTSGYTYT